MFQKARKSQSKARICLLGPAGSGKTYTALTLASALGSRIAVIDTENASASKYADEFDFDVAVLNKYSPDNYIKAIQAAEAAGYDVLIIDSLSHAWSGPEGVLEIVDKAAAKYKDNRFSAWRDATPLHNKLFNTIITSGMHIIATMRTKTEWVLTEDDRGRNVPKRVGTAPVQRDGVEYEFDIVGELDIDHKLVIVKTRCRDLDGYAALKPGPELGVVIKRWLEDGADPHETPATPFDLQKLAEVAASTGYSGEALKALARDVTGKTSSSDLTVADVRALISHMAAHPAGGRGSAAN